MYNNDRKPTCRAPGEAQFLLLLVCEGVSEGVFTHGVGRRMGMQSETKSKEARTAPRARLEQAVRIRPLDPHYQDEVSKTANTSRRGIYFVTSAVHYYVGMDVGVTRGFKANDPLNREENGEVVRIEKLSQGQFGVAIRILGVRQ